MRVQEFIRRAVLATGCSDSEVDQRLRPMRAAGLIPAGRGPNAPRVNGPQATYMLLSLVSRRATDAFDVACRAGKLAMAAPPSFPGAPFGGHLAEKVGPTLAHHLAVLLDYSVSHEVDWTAINVAGDGSEARISLLFGDRPLEVVYCENPAAVAERVQGNQVKYSLKASGHAGYEFRLNRDFIDRIGAQIHHPTVTGWTGDGSPTLEERRQKMLEAKRLHELAELGN